MCTSARVRALLHARVQDEDDGATLFARTDAVLARDARYRRVDLELGAALSRHELNVAARGRRCAAWRQRRAARQRSPPCRHAPGHRAHRPRHAPATCSGAAWPPVAAARCSTAASRSAPAPMAATRTSRTRTCCCRRRPRSTPSRCWKSTPTRSRPRTAPPSASSTDRAVLPALARHSPKPTHARLLTARVLPRGRWHRSSRPGAARSAARRGWTRAWRRWSRHEPGDSRRHPGLQLKRIARSRSTGPLRSRGFPAADATGARQAAGLPRLRQHRAEAARGDRRGRRFLPAPQRQRRRAPCIRWAWKRPTPTRPRAASWPPPQRARRRTGADCAAPPWRSTWSPYSWALPRLKPGDAILLTRMEHHANIVPWQLVAAAHRRAAIKRGRDSTPEGELDLDAL